MAGRAVIGMHIGCGGAGGRDAGTSGMVARHLESAQQ